MKKFLILIIISALVTVITPVAVLNDTLSTEKNTSATEETEPATTEKADTLTVFRSVSKENIEMDFFEYVCGSVAAEMPLAYHQEALKAQAVACYTNALRMKSLSEDDEGYHISDDSSVHQGYISREQRQEKWGEDFEKYESKLESIVKSVEGIAVYYEDELCIAAFHAISCGKTESAENLWGEKVPYLTSVRSDGDNLSPKYSSVVAYEKDDFIEIAKNLTGSKSIKSLKSIIEITEASKSGTALKVSLNNKEFTGEEIRRAFSLRSPVFTVKITDSTVTFNVSGYGHGIGMSQYGADFMARQGSTYEEILKHYYKGAEIKMKSEE